MKSTFGLNLLLVICFFLCSILLIDNYSASAAVVDDNDDGRTESAATESSDSAANMNMDETDQGLESFLMACSQGDMDTVKHYVEKDSKYYVTAYSKHGESCLHVAGILGQTTVTQYILDNGGNPNQRSQYEHGLRMTPLAWNVYGNHMDNVRILLQAGAKVNLDFDYKVDATGTNKKVTVLDLLHIVTNLDESSSSSETTDDVHETKETSSTSSTDDGNTSKASYQQKIREMRDLLLHHGAKRFIPDLDFDNDRQDEL